MSCSIPLSYELESPSDKLFRSMREVATLQSPAVRLSAYREGMEGVAVGGMFLVCKRGDSRQLCDPESTFKRQLKHKQAPKPAGIARLLLQIIKQIKRGQRRCKTTAVYLWGLRGPCERWSVRRFASWLQSAPRLCQHFALEQSCVGVGGWEVLWAQLLLQRGCVGTAARIFVLVLEAV